MCYDNSNFKKREGTIVKIEHRTYQLPSGEVLTIRSLCADDAEALSAFRYATFGETHFLARYPEEYEQNLDAMREGLAHCAESARSFEVGAFAGEKLAGEFGVGQMPHLKCFHRAGMGISVLKEYWGCGLGSYLMQLAIDQTRTNGFEQLELDVYSDNARAIHLYEKFGFERYGATPHGFKLKDGTYRDDILMVKTL